MKQSRNSFVGQLRRGYWVLLPLTPLLAAIKVWFYLGTLTWRAWGVCFVLMLVMQHAIFGMLWVIAATGSRAAQPTKADGLLGAAVALGMGSIIYGGSQLCLRMGEAWMVPSLTTFSSCLAVGIVLAATAVLVRHSLRMIEQNNHAALAQAHSESQRLRAELQALAAQMNPHFLFNALNTVATLVHVDAQQAEDVVVRLADVYRGVLLACQRGGHSLSDELAICRSYADIEQTRFSGRLRVNFDVAEGIDTDALEMPALVVQPLLENAISHGVLSKAEGGQVQVRVHRDAGNYSIAVHDDGIGLGKSLRRGAGASLLNCRKRLEIAYGDAATLDITPRSGGGTTARLIIPTFGATHARVASR